MNVGRNGGDGGAFPRKTRRDDPALITPRSVVTGRGGAGRSRSGNDNHNEPYQVHQSS